MARIASSLPGMGRSIRSGSLSVSINAIVGTDYDKPIATRSPTVPAPTAPLTRPGGVFRRFFDGFRYR